MAQLDAKTAAKLTKDPVFRKLLMEYEKDPIGSKAQERDFKKLLDYVHRYFISRGK